MRKNNKSQIENAIEITQQFGRNFKLILGPDFEVPINIGGVMKKTIYNLLAIAALVTVSFSCQKKSSNTVTAKKSAGSSLVSQQVINNSVATGAQYGVNYTIATIDYPNCTNGSCSVNIEVKTPSGSYLQFTTNHYGTQDSYGSYSDPSGAYLQIQARCSGSACDTYALIVNVQKNSQVMFQSAAISYKNDCNFYVANLSSQYNMYQSIDQLIQYSTSAVPQNNCPQQ